MNAVIKVGGKQYYVTEGTEIFAEKIDAVEGDVVTFNQVLAIDSKVGNKLVIIEKLSFTPSINVSYTFIFFLFP